MSVERSMQQAYAVGRRNREILDLLAQHCAHAEVEYAGGHGMAEAASELPIDSRTIRCKFARNPVGSGMNMEWIAVEFYRANCVGCPHRQPVGIPNLATYVAGLDGEAARQAEEQHQLAEAIDRRRRERAERRSPLATSEALAAAAVLDDLDIVDAPTQAEPDTEARDGARRRIVETARRAPEAFSTVVVDQLCALAAEPGHNWLFEALRHLARSRNADPRRLIELALDALQSRRSAEASHVLVDLRDSLEPVDLSGEVTRSLIHLAGTPELHGLTGAFSRGRVRDRAGLILAIELAFPSVLKELGHMLRAPDRGEGAELVPELWLPPGVGRRIGPSPAAIDRDNDRAAAAVAARTVLTAAPESASTLCPQLLKALQIPDADSYGVAPVAEIKETLASLLLEQPAVVLPLLVDAGASGSEEDRDHLLDVAEGAVHRLPRLISPALEDDRMEVGPVDEAGDFPRHRLGPVDVGTVSEQLFAFALDRLSGDWGHRVASDAARLVETLVGHHPAELFAAGRGADAVLGHLINAAENPRPISDLMPPGPLAALDQFSRDQARYSILHQLRKALRALAGEGPELVLDRVEPLLDAPLPPGPPAAGSGEISGAPSATAEQLVALDLREELITLLGDLAHDHALVPGILRRVLPRLTTHLLGEHPSLRAAAIRAWAEAFRGGQPLPSTLSDCLPVLLTDGYFVVIGALLDVLPSLLYHKDRQEDRHLPLVVRWIHAVDPAIRSKRPHLVPEMINVLRAVADRVEDPLRTQFHAAALDLGSELSGYDLERHLTARWPVPVSTGSRFARLCLKALADPSIDDDRDQVITSLLTCWPGAATLVDEEISGLADAVPPEYPLMAGDQVELLGRLGRFSVADTLTEQLLTRVPPVPAADTARAIATAMHAATQLEATVVRWAGSAATESPAGRIDGITAAGDAAEASMSATRAELDREDPTRAGLGLPSRPSGPASGMLDALTSRVAAVRALSSIVEQTIRGDEAEDAANACESAAESLRHGYLAALPTADAYGYYADALEIIAFLVRADAATQRADAATSTAQLDAAHRRAEVVAERLATAHPAPEGVEEVAPDPLTAGVAAVATRAVTAGPNDARELAGDLLSIGLPIRVIPGRCRYVRGTRAVSAPSSAEQEPAPEPIVVCLLSVDDHPLTEHAQVLRREQVYMLSVDVRGAGWPNWADRLELEPISELTETELILPSFEFDRPAGLTDVGEYQLTASGALVLRFALASGRPAIPVRLTGRFTGPSDDPSQPGHRRRAVADVAGHPQVRLRPFDSTRDLLTGYPQADERLLELFTRLHGRFPDDQLEPFGRFLTAIVLAAERIQFDKTYKLGARVSEATFHDDLEARLRDDPSLGGRITRRDQRALGFLDLDHDQITAELKVERTTPVTPENCHKFLGQPTQYAAGADRRLSILVVLDMTRKQSPPGVLENYVWLMQPAAHGLTDPAYPSVVAVVVINANNRVPSGWAGRRVDAIELGEGS